MPETPDDSRLTAFALGELDPLEASAVEAELARDPEGRAVVLEIQAAARLLADHLRAEPTPGLAPGHRQAIEDRLTADSPRRRRWPRSVLAASLLGIAAGLTWAALRPGPAERQDRLIARNEVAKASSPEMAAPEAILPAPAAAAVAPGPASGSLGVSPPAGLKLEDHAADSPPPGQVSAQLAARESPETSTFRSGPAADRARRMGPPPAVTQATGPGAAEPSARSLEPLAKAAKAKSLMRAAEVPGPAKLDLATGLGRSQASDTIFRTTDRQPTSTFPVAVGTGSYASVARDLDGGVLPPAEAVRTEQLINAFAYEYPDPKGADPIGCDVEVARCPWDGAHRLVRIGLKGRNGVGSVAVQVRFHPARAASYRLIGYEDPSRVGPTSEPSKPEASPLPAGRDFTALYEVVPAADRGDNVAAAPPATTRLLDVEIRCTTPDSGVSRLMTRPAEDSDRAFAAASGDFRFASAVSGFGMLLKDSPAKGSLTWATLIDQVSGSLGADPRGERARLLELCRKAAAIHGP